MSDRIIIEGICQAVTQKAVLLCGADDDSENWFPLRYVRVISGYIGRGAFAEISVPGWLHESKQHENQVLPSSAPVIPPDMLRRLIQLCHPDKHGGKASAEKATEWLLSQR